MITHEGGSICADCKSVYFQRLREGVVDPPRGFRDLTPATTGIRFGGYLLDWVAMNILAFVAAASLAVFFNLSGHPDWTDKLVASGRLFGFIISLSYLTLTTATLGAPLGAWLVGLSVVTHDGEKLGLLRAVWRSFSFFIGSALCFAGPLSVASEGNLAIHDRLSGSRVIRRKPKAPAPPPADDSSPQPPTPPPPPAFPTVI